jgi:hypothetical protein
MCGFWTSHRLQVTIDDVQFMAIFEDALDAAMPPAFADWGVVSTMMHCGGSWVFMVNDQKGRRATSQTNC